jgi:hypothetical protein
MTQLEQIVAFLVENAMLAGVALGEIDCDVPPWTTERDSFAVQILGLIAVEHQRCLHTDLTNVDPSKG